MTVDIMMLRRHHRDVRTTLTLDDDVAAKLKAAARRTGLPFRAVVNDTLRRGLVSVRAPAREPFHISPRSLGGLKAGVQIDDVAALLEQVEGPLHR